jgi:preprotein translocase subunit SecB
VLFPYVRQTVSDVITKGGFPTFFLPPVNFDALYERSLAERAAQQGAGHAAGAQQVN